MKKIAVFGKPGSGKSTLSKTLAESAGVPFYPLDSMVYNADGSLVERAVFDAQHENILQSEAWLIDGLGPMASFQQRLQVADTLVYIDLPYWLSYWLVTKRLLKGLFITPEGWPPGSSIVKGSLQSYKMLRLSPRFWNSDFSQKLTALGDSKNLHVIRTLSELNQFVAQIKL